MEHTYSETLPKDTNAALLEVAANIQKLGDVYVEETQALDNVDNKRFLELQGKKLLVAREYQNNMGQMLARKSEIKNTSATIKKKLKQAHEDFLKISRANMKSIERMQRCTEKLCNTLRNAAIRDAHKQSGYSYGENGSISNNAKRKAVSSGLSETV